MLVIIGSIVVYVGYGYYEEAQDRQQIVKLLHDCGVGEWADDLVGSRVNHVFSGSESLYCRLTIPPEQVQPFLDKIHIGQRVAATQPSRPFPFYFQREAWWHPESETDLQIIEFQPGGGKVRRAAAGSTTSGNVYVPIEGH